MRYASTLGVDSSTGTAYVCVHRQSGVEMHAKVAYAGRGDDVASTDLDRKKSGCGTRWFSIVHIIASVFDLFKSR